MKRLIILFSFLGTCAYHSSEIVRDLAPGPDGGVVCARITESRVDVYRHGEFVYGETRPTTIWKVYWEVSEPQFQLDPNRYWDTCSDGGLR